MPVCAAAHERGGARSAWDSQMFSPHQDLLHNRGLAVDAQAADDAQQHHTQVLQQKQLCCHPGVDAVHAFSEIKRGCCRVSARKTSIYIAPSAMLKAGSATFDMAPKQMLTCTRRRSSRVSSGSSDAGGVAAGVGAAAGIAGVVAGVPRAAGAAAGRCGRLGPAPATIRTTG